MNILEQIMENDPESEFLKADGFDDAVIGICYASNRLIYSSMKMIQIMVSQGMTELEAIEFFDFNIGGAYVGENTPIYNNDLNFHDYD